MTTNFQIIYDRGWIAPWAACGVPEHDDIGRHWELTNRRWSLGFDEDSDSGLARHVGFVVVVLRGGLRAAIRIDAARFIDILTNSGPQAGASARRASGKLDAIAPDDTDHDFDATDRAGLSFHTSVFEIVGRYHLKFWVLSYSGGVREWPGLRKVVTARE